MAITDEACLGDNFDRALTEFPAECDAVMGREWVTSAKEALAGCASDTRAEMQSQLCLFLLNDTLHWFCGKKVGYQRGGNKDPLRMLLRAVRRQLELASPTVEPATPTPSEEYGGLPSMSEESLQGWDIDKLRKKCLELANQLNIERQLPNHHELQQKCSELTEQLRIAHLDHRRLAENYRLQGLQLAKAWAKAAPPPSERDEALAGQKQARADRRAISNRLTQEMSHTIKAVEDFKRLSASYAQMSLKHDELLDALGALSQPDGTIRGPLLDGPELDALNVALCRNSESALHGRDELIVAAERLLNVTGPRGLALESEVSVALTHSEHHELAARRELHDAIMHTKTIGPDGPYDPEKAKQEVRVAANQFMACTKDRDYSLRVKFERNSLTPDEIQEWNARRALITAHEKECH